MAKEERKTKDGKKLYVDRVNISDVKNMHPIENDQMKYFHSMNQQEYKDKSKEEYQAPPMQSIKKKKNSFVHTQIANKSKTNNDHLENLTKNLNSNKMWIL